MTYQKRTNFVKQLYCNDQLHQIERKHIPSSTGAYWRKQFQENENIFDNNAISKLITNFNSTINLLLHTISKNKKKYWKNNILLLNDALNECPTDKDRLQILTLLKIPLKAYAKWTKTPFTCEQSLFGLCIKKHPSQLVEAEKSIIIKYMEDPELILLNTYQVYCKLINDKALMIHYNTFIKYCNALHINRKKIKKQSKRKTKGITSEYYLQKIHLDLTQIGLLDNSTAYILNIVDNFTRKLLACKASVVVGSRFVANVLEAIIMHYNLNDIGTEIYTDGGPENKKHFKKMLKKYKNIKHKVCKVDTPHLNNIVEAAHKRFKNNVLPQNHFQNFKHLNNELPTYHETYNNIGQRHLNGMTPNQAEQGLKFDYETYKTLNILGAQKRKEINRKLICCKIKAKKEEQPLGNTA